MPELPEAERARQAIERALNREIVAVDDSDTYVCRPHAPGEIAAALTGRRLTAAHRRGKFMWVETDDGGGPRNQTVAALPSIIRTLRSRGYGFETIPDLLGLKPVYG